MAELIQFSKARVGYKAPDVIIALDDMPTTAVGKVDRVRLKELAGEASNGPIGDAPRVETGA
jgi:long-chain acyl-CoA synthetase